MNTIPRYMKEYANAQEYKIFKTAKKTATENNLTLADPVMGSKIKRIFDFSLLDDMTITEEEKEVIKAEAIKHFSSSDKISYYGKQFDNFSACDGIANYYTHRVFSTSGKHLYNIYQLANIKHYQKSRKHSYDKYYDVTTYTASESYTEPLNDIEIS